MGIIQDLQAKSIELERINNILSAKINSLELSVANLSSIVPNIKQNSISPELKKTLDVPNLYLGEKGVSSYDKFGKLDIEFDETDNLWKARGGTIDGGLFKLELLSEGTEFIEVPTWIPSSPNFEQRTVPLNIYDIFEPSEVSIRGYFLVIEYIINNYHAGRHNYPPYTPDLITSKASIINFAKGTYEEDYRRFRIDIVTSSKSMERYEITDYDNYNVHYKLYNVIAINGENFGDYQLIM